MGNNNENIRSIGKDGFYGEMMEEISLSKDPYMLYEKFKELREYVLKEVSSIKKENESLINIVKDAVELFGKLREEFSIVKGKIDSLSPKKELKNSENKDEKEKE